MNIHGNRFVGAIKRGVSGVQSAYAQQKRAAEERAKLRMESAKTGYEKERIKAELERGNLRLQREMYDAKAAVQREKEAVAKAKRAAGVRSVGERASEFIGTTAKSIRSLQKKGNPPKRRAKATVKRKIIAKRTVTRRR